MKVATEVERVSLNGSSNTTVGNNGDGNNFGGNVDSNNDSLAIKKKEEVVNGTSDNNPLSTSSVPVHTNSNTLDFSKEGTIKIDFVEMNRQKERINEVGEAVSGVLEKIILHANTLAGLVNSECRVDLSMVDSIKPKMQVVTGFMDEQVDSYIATLDDTDKELAAIVERIYRTGTSQDEIVYIDKNGNEQLISKANLKDIINQNTIDSSKYSGLAHAGTRASQDCKDTVGIITYDNLTYTIVDRYDDIKHPTPGTISRADYELMIQQVAGESGNSPDDMLGVATTMLNRMEASGYSNTLRGVLEQGYFPWGKTYQAYAPGGKYYNTDWGQEKLKLATEVVNDALNGARNLNSNVYFYTGNGTYNSFRDVL